MSLKYLEKVEGDDMIHHGEVVILASFVILGLGAFLRHSTRSLPLPYTMQLLIIGAILGLLLRRNDWDDTFKDSIKMLGNVDPHLMLHIFLPPLVFESAASLEWHLFTKSKWYILALAGPGLLLASGLTGIIINFLIQNHPLYDDIKSSNGSCHNEVWPPSAGLLLGVIMSATDPVAVVALLKDLGCKSSLSTIIEGESLLNDGTALVMFTILIKIIKGDTSDGADEYVWTFVKMSLGGAMFGTFFAVIIVRWLGTIFNDALSEITITLSAAYLCFFISEYFFHVSGIIAVVCLGLYFGNTGRTSVSPEVVHFLDEFWEVLAFFGNTLIFVIAGIVIGYKLPSVPFSHFGTHLAILYVSCTIIRVLVIYISFVLFRFFGMELEEKDQIVTVWGGLRGAVGLSLAMMVFGDDSICQSIRDTVMFHTAGIVVLTVCINSITMPKLVSILGLDAVAPPKQYVYDQALINLQKAAARQESTLRSDHIFNSAVWEEARKFYFRVPSMPSPKDRIKHNSEERNLDAKEVRRRVLMITKQSYWKQFEDGILSNDSVKFLVHHTDLAIDQDCSLNEWNIYVELIRLSSSKDKKSDHLVHTERLSQKQQRHLEIKYFLESTPVLLIVLFLVGISCTLAFILDPQSTIYRIIEHTTTFIFFIELCARLFCVQDWQAFIVDPYLIIDTAAISLDILLLSTTDLLGIFSDYSKALRGFRFLRLVRLLRLARVANRLKRVKIVAPNENTHLWDKTESWIDKYRQRILFSQLKHGYEVATGFKVAREEAASTLEHFPSSGNDLNEVQTQIEKDLKCVRTALLDIQRLYGEIAASITTSVAARTVLNKQRLTILELYRDGFLDCNEHKKLKGSVEYQMKRLTYHPPIILMPKKRDILGQIPWLECVGNEELSKITDAFEDTVFQRGDILVQQNDKSESLHVLARGTVAVVLQTEDNTEVEIEELGFGSVFGEIAWALKCNRGASIIASSPGLLFTITGAKLREMAEANIDLETRLWETCGRRLSENLISMQLENIGKPRREIREIVHDMQLYSVDPSNKTLRFNTFGTIILLRGRAILEYESSEANEVIEAPQILQTKCNVFSFSAEFSTNSMFMCHPDVMHSKNRSSTVPINTGMANKSSIEVIEYQHSNHISNKNGKVKSSDTSSNLDSSSQHETCNTMKRRVTLDFSQLHEVSSYQTAREKTFFTRGAKVVSEHSICSNDGANNRKNKRKTIFSLV